MRQGLYGGHRLSEAYSRGSGPSNRLSVGSLRLCWIVHSTCFYGHDSQSVNGFVASGLSRSKTGPIFFCGTLTVFVSICLTPAGLLLPWLHPPLQPSKTESHERD